MSTWTPEAQRLWEQLPAETQHLILTHVWCPHCGQARRMALIGGTIIVDDLVLTGLCTVCGHRVARLLEGDGLRPSQDAEPAFQPGEEVIWLKRVPGGPYVIPMTATVIARTAKRVKIVADDEGQMVTRYVPSESLERRA
ncbi:MAG: hypothetical protein HGA45_13980 [Chloroflexales bacterium]|nr:hypothetical protein [Chloroflexales bacterium]